LGSSRFAERAVHILSGTTSAPEPKDAATVILMRADTSVFLLQRSAGMAFAPGAQVFPGGRVDPADSDPDVPWSGPSAEELGEILGVDAPRARALVCAAVRETFEECGVLLASGSPLPSRYSRDFRGYGNENHGSLPQIDADGDRAALAAHEVSLAELLRRRGLVLRADLLTPWARWVTPVIEARRYDTFFFVAALPEGAAAGGSAEADAVGWFTPGAALDAARAGDAWLLPPTAVCMGELAGAGDVRSILRQRRSIRPVCPAVTEADGQFWLVIPDEVEYPL
jgi:8-oxo-dGTP pyrophosphatase MutT (NUDIX family)